MSKCIKIGQNEFYEALSEQEKEVYKELESLVSLGDFFRYCKSNDTIFIVFIFKTETFDKLTDYTIVNIIIAKANRLKDIDYSIIEKNKNQNSGYKEFEEFEGITIMELIKFIAKNYYV